MKKILIVDCDSRFSKLAIDALREYCEIELIRPRDFYAPPQYLISPLDLIDIQNAFPGVPQLPFVAKDKIRNEPLKIWADESNDFHKTGYPTKHRKLWRMRRESRRMNRKNK